MNTTIPAGPTRVDALLARARRSRGRVVFALDATASRQPTWDAAARLTSDMFDAVAGLDVQLVYYRGVDECTASRWFSDARSLAVAMSTIICRAGETQVARILDHVNRENAREKVAALVFIGDAVEEARTDLIERARVLSVPIFVFQEGSDPAVAAVFRELAEITHGAYATFDPSAAQRLGDLLRAVCAFATGGVEALANQQTNAARLLLGQIR